MKSIWMMFALLVSVVGCGQLQLPKVIVVTPLNEQDILDAKAAALIAANSERVEEIDEEASVTKCLCGGTGRSGDGLGPCACPDGCSCKKTSSEATGAEIETEPAISESDGAISESDGAVSASKPVSSESAADHDEQDSEPTVQQQAPPSVEQNLDSINQSLSQLTDHTANLAEKYTATVKTTLDLEDRVAKLEAAAVEAEKLKASEAALTKKAAETPTRPNQQLVILYADKDLTTIERWEETNGAALVDVGWTIGADETFQIVKLRIESDDATKFPRAYELAKQNGTPYFAYHYKGEFKQGQNSLPDSAVLSDRLNALVVKPVTASSTTTEEPWRYVEETWPARVPINGTRTPSKEVLVWHLRGGGTGGENHRQDYYASWPLEQMTPGQLVTLHDQDHPVTASTRTVQQAVFQQPMRVIQRGSGTVQYRQRTCVNGKCF